MDMVKGGTKEIRGPTQKLQLCISTIYPIATRPRCFPGPTGPMARQMPQWDKARSPLVASVHPCTRCVALSRRLVISIAPPRQSLRVPVSGSAQIIPRREYAAHAVKSSPRFLAPRLKCVVP